MNLENCLFQKYSQLLTVCSSIVMSLYNLKNLHSLKWKIYRQQYTEVYKYDAKKTLILMKYFKLYGINAEWLEVNLFPSIRITHETNMQRTVLDVFYTLTVWVDRQTDEMTGLKVITKKKKEFYSQKDATNHVLPSLQLSKDISKCT